MWTYYSIQLFDSLETKIGGKVHCLKHKISQVILISFSKSYFKMQDGSYRNTFHTAFMMVSIAIVTNQVPDIYIIHR